MLVYFHPHLHIRTSSTRSCNQNTGPTLATNLLKLTVVIGMLSGSLVLSSAVLDLRGLADVGIEAVLRRSADSDFAGLKVVLPAAAAAAGVEHDGNDVLILVSGRTGLEAGDDCRRIASEGIST